jgi:hypothetical protein
MNDKDAKMELLVRHESQRFNKEAINEEPLANFRFDQKPWHVMNLK